MKTVLWTLSVAAISALVWVAYQRPKRFAKHIFLVAWWLPTFLMLIYTVMRLVQLGMNSELILEYRDEPAKADAFRRLAVKDARVFLYLLKVWSVYAAWICFVLLLRYLPRIVGPKPVAPRAGSSPGA